MICRLKSYKSLELIKSYRTENTEILFFYTFSTEYVYRFSLALFLVIMLLNILAYEIFGCLILY